jgi:hypothetical protein
VYCIELAAGSQIGFLIALHTAKLRLIDNSQGERTVANLSWVKCTGDVWCGFHTVDLSNVKTTGVYLIWQGGGSYVRVGQGDIAARLTAHRNDPAITKYQKLYVTWAAVPSAQLDGVERYLYEQCSPLVGERTPTAPVIAVNLPA